MTDSRNPSGLQRVVGWLMLFAGVSVFMIRLRHAGPYGFPGGGNLLAGVLALLLGGWLARAWLGAHRLAAPLGWIALAASPIVLFFALYATLAEVEEVVVLKATVGAGRPVDLRLWIVDRADVAWVTMPRSKADAHGLSEARVELLRQGEVSCVIATRHEDRATVDAIHRLRHQKYGVQRLATTLGIFGRSADEDVVALRLDPCPRGSLRTPREFYLGSAAAKQQPSAVRLAAAERPSLLVGRSERSPDREISIENRHATLTGGVLDGLVAQAPNNIRQR